MSRGIFITGTGTDVGKTFVTALIIKKLRQYGLSAGYYKAALSGTQYRNGELIPGDAEYVKKIAGLQNESCTVSYIYGAAVSPHLAAQREKGPYVEMEKLVRDFDNIKHIADYITVEGSGGIVCPLRSGEKAIMLTDVIKLFALDIVIVADGGLGTINSTVLTVEYARSQGINIKGIIMNNYDKDNYLHVDNKYQLETLTGISVIGCLEENTCDINIEKQTMLGLYKELI